MKKILLGTTAIAAAALYAQAAQAQITVSLGGYTEFFGAYYDDDAPNRTSREFQLETEIVVRADGKADNGLLQTRRETLALERELTAQEASCLFVSHDRAFVRAVANRFWLIEKRKLIEVDGPEAFFEEAALLA